MARTSTLQRDQPARAKRCNRLSHVVRNRRKDSGMRASCVMAAMRLISLSSAMQIVHDEPQSPR